MRKLIGLVVLGLLVIGVSFTPAKHTAVKGCTNCCSWSTDCSIGWRCCSQASPCSTEPLLYGRCEKVKVCSAG